MLQKNELKVLGDTSADKLGYVLDHVIKAAENDQPTKWVLSVQ